MAVWIRGKCIDLSGRAERMKIFVSCECLPNCTYCEEAFSNQVDMVTRSVEVVNLFPQWSQCLLNGPMEKSLQWQEWRLHMDSKPGLLQG